MSLGFIRSSLPEKVTKTSSGYLFSRALTTHGRYPIYPEDVSSSIEGISSSLYLKDITKWQQQQHHQRLQNGFSNADFVLNKLISLCANTASLFLGIQVHSAVVKLGFCSNVFIGSALVDLYGKCGALCSAQKVFDEIPERNVVTWNTLMSGYLHAESGEKAVGLFLDMLRYEIAPTGFSLSAVLVGCSQLRWKQLGAQVHGFSLKAGLYNNLVLRTGLIDTYSKCSDMGNSRRVFDETPDGTIYTYTSMITGYSQSQQPEEAMSLFIEMQRTGITPSYVTYNNLLSSFCSPAYMDHCRQVHCRIIEEGFESDAFVAVSLMTVYSECGNSLKDFLRICSGIIVWDQITWNAAIAGFSSLGSDNEALKWFSHMRRAGIMMDSFTFTSTLKAIGNTSALEDGKHAHALVFKAGYASNLCVQNGLLTMYARCGAISDSHKVFSSMGRRDLITWNSLLTGCASHGYGNEAIEIFEQMRRAGVTPNHTTFLSVLTACSHVGLLDRGLEYFDLMKSLPEPPGADHYACIVDLYARAGYLNEAEAFISSFPMKPVPSVYKALLSACKVHGNREIAIRAAEQLAQLCPDDPATYILLSNVLANEGHWDDAAGIRKIMYRGGVQKDPAYSWI